MKHKLIIRLLFLLALPLSFATQGSASQMQGKVVDILDGERITVVSVSQPVKVKIMALATPTGTQRFADVATQHLKDLILNKYVAVSYNSMNADGFIVGRVMLTGMDVGSQMIRDGVGWYDKSEAANLGETERQSYVGSELAARKEARGLWRDSEPVAPWEYRLLEAANQNVISRPQMLVAKSAGSGKQELRNEDLFSSLAGGNSLPGSASVGDDPGWKTLAPHLGRFSVYVPANAVEFAASVPTPSGKTAAYNYAIGKRGTKAYLVIWGKGPGETSDVLFADDVANGLIFGLNRTMGDTHHFEMKRLRSLRLGPFAGWQYKITAAGTPGTIRVFTRRVGELREVYAMAALNGTEDDRQVQEFLGSFTIGKY